MNLLTPPSAISSKDLSLREDIRLLGRILGDTLREQEGVHTFDLVENIRRAAVHFRKTQDEGDRAHVEKMLDALSTADTLLVVRAFSFFAQLSNIAEDLHHNRRRRTHLKAGSPPQEGSLQLALERVENEHIKAEELQVFFNKALISPVLTAHPTEVQRKSILDCQLIISKLMSERDRIDLTPEELADNEEMLRRFILILWHTRMLRTAKLTVRDEIKNGLEYYRYTFLTEIPNLYADLEKQLEKRYGKRLHIPPFLQIGSWIGGDRDGNPFVTHTVMQNAISRQSSLVLEHYLVETHLLGTRLSLTTRLIKVSRELEMLAAESLDKEVSRDDEPYRRALIAIYSRLVTTAEDLGQNVKHLRPVNPDAKKYDGPQAFIRDLDILINSLYQHKAVFLARGRLANLRRAVEVFGFYLTPLDMRQHSAVHEQVVNELFALGADKPGYAEQDEAGRRAWLLAALLENKSLLGNHLVEKNLVEENRASKKTPQSHIPQGDNEGTMKKHAVNLDKFSSLVQGELHIMLTAAEIHQRFGHAALP
ncbi:MAG: phosphoenolpyruvate carboxylase, partial [Candidatus Nitrotoga sp.]